MAEQAFINFKTRKELVISVSVVLAIAFGTMITSSYTADHIKKSSCDMSKDANLKRGYNWAMTSAILSATLTLAMGAVIVKVFTTKK